MVVKQAVNLNIYCVCFLCREVVYCILYCTYGCVPNRCVTDLLSQV